MDLFAFFFSPQWQVHGCFVSMGQLPTNQDHLVSTLWDCFLLFQLDIACLVVWLMTNNWMWGKKQKTKTHLDDICGLNVSTGLSVMRTKALWKLNVKLCRILKSCSNIFSYEQCFFDSVSIQSLQKFNLLHSQIFWRMHTDFFFYLFNWKKIFCHKSLLLHLQIDNSESNCIVDISVWNLTQSTTANFS